MSAKPHEIAEFFRQLELLTRAGLPLPESLWQLSGEYHHRGIRKICTELSEATGHGELLSDAMRKHGDVFSPMLIRMVEVGEKDGALPEVMREIYNISRRHYQLASMMREIMLYPFITIMTGIFIMIGLLYYILPSFYNNLITENMNSYRHNYTSFSNIMQMTSVFVQNNIIAILIICVAILVFGIWLFISSRYSNRILLRLSRSLPYADIIFYNLSMARFCAIWAALIRRQIPTAESFSLLSETADFPPLAGAFKRVAVNCEAGKAPLDCLDEEHDISRLLVAALKSSPETERAEQLENMADVFYSSGDYGFHRAGLTWEFLALIGMVLVVGLIIIMTFMPYISKLFNN